MPPQAPAKHALLDATKFANTCPQVTELGAFAGPSSTTEDCLYLNVFTTDTSPAKAVLVWIHGGGNVDGETNDYDASKLAKSGVVVVTVNYRMGLFGFLSQSALNAEGHPWGNYGILDQQAALRWVQANIAAFGGDATKVALGGQSAGSQDTTANLLSPAAAGLFHRAINQSSPTANLLAGNGMTSAQVALQRGNNFAAAAGCSSSACLRDLTAARILQLQGTPNANSPYVTGPFVDGTIIPIQPQVAWSSGQYNKMPIMGGAVKEESLFGESIREYFSGPPQTPLDAATYNNLVNATYVPPLYVAGAAAQVLAQYPAGSNPQATYARSFTDPGKCRSLHVLKLQASTSGFGVYGYDFTYQNAPYYFPKMPNPQEPSGNFMARAAHTIDIQFLFDNWHGGQLGVNLDQTTGQPRELQGTELTLSDQLVAAWTNFTKTGNPNGTGAPVWPVTTAGSATFLQEDIPNANETEVQYRANYQCNFWDPLIVYPTN
jgi:para-nitrobenzyl esterase